MVKLILIPTIAFASMAAAEPTDSNGTTMAVAGNEGSAQQASATASTSNVQAAPEEKKICKALPSSGTRFSKTACLTAKEWKQVEADVQNENGY